MNYYLTSDPGNGEPKKVFGPYESHNVALGNVQSIGKEHGGRIEMHTAEIICDFCSSPDVKWSYPAADFVELQTAWGSTGEWAACDGCHDLIEANDREALTAHSVDTYYKRYPGTIPDTPQIRKRMAQEITFLHDAFFLAREGAPHEEVRP